MALKDLHQAALSYQSRTNDVIDDHNSPIARSLKRELQAFEDDVQVEKNARSIDDRMKRIINLFEEARSREVISAGDATQMIRMGEEWREKLRKFY